MLQEPKWIIGIISGAIVFLLLFGVPLKLLRLVGQVVIKIAVGAIFLFFLNTIGNHFGLHVPINVITASIAGLLGIPGVLALGIIQMWVR